MEIEGDLILGSSPHGLAVTERKSIHLFLLIVYKLIFPFSSGILSNKYVPHIVEHMNVK